MTIERHFLYVHDPMCSWCYGFAPVMMALCGAFEGRLGIKTMVGGMRAGNTRPMGADDKVGLAEIWSKVGAATGQQFDHRFFAREGFVYDTEPACRAVVVARRLKPHIELEFNNRIQAAFYAENRDTTSTDVLVEIAAEAGFDGDAFGAEMLNPEARKETLRDFLIAKEMGVDGFPMLAVGDQRSGYARITNGYHPIDGMVAVIEGWLARRATAD